MLPPSNSPSDASALRRRARPLSGIGRSTSAYSPGPSDDFGATRYCPRPSRVLLRIDVLFDDRPARQRARVGAVGFGCRHEAIIVVRCDQRDDRGLIAVGIHAGNVREVDLEQGIEVEHARARRRRERPHGRALLVGTEQAAERRRDTADGGIHECERLARDPLQILHALAAPAGAGERDLRDRRRDGSAAPSRSATRAAPGPRATPAARARVAPSRLLPVSPRAARSSS